MASTRDIRRRIRSVTSTSQITKAMQMVAASKMRKAQQTVLAARPFMHLLYRIQRKATTQSVDFSHDLLEIRPVGKVAVILVGGDKGLCGSLNTNLFRIAAQFDTQSTIFITAGRRAAQFVSRTRRTLAAEFSYGDNPTYREARTIATMARDLFLNHEVDQVKVVSTAFINTLTQKPVSIDFLPVGPITNLKMEGLKLDHLESEEELARHTGEFLFEPRAESLMAYLLPIYLDLYIYMALVNAKASEQSARMVAMKNATENAQSLVRDLTLEYNKRRQGNITQELLEIVGGQLATE